MPLTFEYSEIKNFQLARVEGTLRIHDVPELKTVFEALEAREGNVALDLSAVPAVDKGAFPLFINMQKRLSGRGKKFCLIGLTQRVERALQEVNLDSKLTLYANRQAFDDEAAGVTESLFPPADYDFKGKLYKILELKCELCGTGNIRAFVLNRATQEARFDGKGIAPTFKGREGFNDLDILSFLITLCPGCYFATQHISYFTDPHGEFKSMLQDKEKLALAKELNARRQVAKAGSFQTADQMLPPFAGLHRFHAYLLAEESAHTLHRNGNRLAVYDLGLYNAVLTRLCLPGLETEYLRKAFMWFGEIDKHRSDYSKHMVMETCFYLSVIGYHLKKPKEAKKYLLDFKAIGETEANLWAAHLQVLEKFSVENEPA